MNKKILAAACGLLVSSGFAFAQDDMNFYVGADLGYNKHGYSSEFKDFINNSFTPDTGTLKSKVPSLGILFGGKFHENFGAEVGYTFFKKAKVDWTNATGNWNTDYIKANNVYADLVGYMPIDNCFDLLGTVGLGRLKIKYNDNNNAGIDVSKGKVGFRIGAGVQYKFDEHFAARAMVRYQQANIKPSNSDVKAYKNLSSINLGLTYTI